MPRLDDEVSMAKFDQRRIMLFGEPFTRKTTWALRAAAMGYNVILCDFDNGWQVAKTMPEWEQIKKKTFRLDMRPPTSPLSKNCAAVTLGATLRSGSLFYDEIEREKAVARTFTADKTYAKIDLMAATENDVLIIDTWTAYTTQIFEFFTGSAKELNVDHRTEQGAFMVMRQAADRLLDGLQSLPCHVIIVGHEIEYAKRKADAGKKDAPDQAIESISTVVASVTKAHGQTIGKNMSAVLHFGLVNSRQGIYISTKAEEGLAVGSRFTEPMRKPWQELGIEEFLPPLTNPSDTYNSKAVTEVSGEEILSAGAAEKGKTVLDGQQKPTIKLGK